MKNIIIILLALIASISQAQSSTIVVRHTHDVNSSKWQTFEPKVLSKSPDYCVFTWNADTVDTALLTDFFRFMGFDSLNAQDSKNATLIFMNDHPKEIAVLNAVMEQATYLSLSDYACFWRLRNKVVRVIKN